jgi:hypothetical protein
MKSKTLGLLAVVMLAGPIAAIATPVTWEVQGSLAIVDGSYRTMGLDVGDAFSVLINFDTAAARMDGATGLNGFNQGQPETNQFVMRGPVLDIFNCSALPGTPDPLLVSLRTSVFQAFTGTNASVGFIEGQLSSIRNVPEPGTLVPLGFGLAGFGMSGRR